MKKKKSVKIIVYDEAGDIKPLPKWFMKFMKKQRVAIIPKGRFIGKNYFYDYFNELRF